MAAITVKDIGVTKGHNLISITLHLSTNQVRNVKNCRSLSTMSMYPHHVICISESDVQKMSLRVGVAQAGVYDCLNMCSTASAGCYEGLQLLITKGYAPPPLSFQIC